MTATGSRPGSSRTWATVKVADISSETSTRPSPAERGTAARAAVTRPTPASESANPAQATGRATVWCHSAAMTATSTGTAPMSRAAWVTLVRLMPAFCTMTDPPYPIAPETSSLASTDALAPPPAGDGQQDRGGQPEPRDGEPARGQPLQGQLGQGHGGAPQQPGRDQGCDGVTAADVHTAIFAAPHTKFAAQSLITRYYLVKWQSHLMMLTSSC